MKDLSYYDCKNTCSQKRNLEEEKQEKRTHTGNSKPVVSEARLCVGYLLRIFQQILQVTSSFLIHTKWK